MRRLTLCLAALILSRAVAQVPSDAEIRKILVDRIGSENLGIGMVVGVVDANGRRIVAYGSLAKNDNRRLDGDTVFEIGSMTKVFTSLLLMDMTRRGEVALTDPVSKFLPPSVKMPERNGRKITLADLSTQSSGLPRLPNNMAPKDPANPYADYTVQQMYDFLSRYELTRDISSKYEYSNLGVGLLGHVLSLRAGMSYEELIRKRILHPLGMSSTTITLSAEEKKRLAPGYNGALMPVKNWDLDALAGAGALRSTANDMLKFLAANLELTDTPLKAALRRMRAVRKDTGMANVEIAMGWHVFEQYGDIWWHNGGTGGYRSFAGFDPVKKTAVVVLCNTSFDVDDIGRHALDSRYPAPLIKPRTVIELTPETLESYVGEYQFGPKFAITVTRDGSKLFAQPTDQPRVELFAEKENEFFLKVIDAQVTFAKDDAGKVTALVLHQGGADQKAAKIK